MRRALVVLTLLMAFPAAASSQGLEHVKSHYTKYEYRIPMRDGARLFTAVYVPKDDSVKYPILLNRTPYSVAPYGADQYKSDLGPTPLFGKAGYIFAYQDVRGRLRSDGEFVHMRPHVVEGVGREPDESSDTFDTINWLLGHVPNHNGKVGQSGISYPGFYTVCGMIDAHPALVAVSPQAPVADWFVGDDWHHNGALFLAHAFRFLEFFPKQKPENLKRLDALRFDYGTPDGYDFFLNVGPLSNVDARYFKGASPFWNELMTHGTYDRFWQERDIRRHIRGIRPAVLTVGGWFDAENLHGALETFKRVEATGVPKGGNHLVMGPWWHGSWSRDDGLKLGDINFGSKTGEYYREMIELPFFEYHLKGKGDGKFPKAWVFETGTNVWRKFAAWPPKNVVATSYELNAGGVLGGRGNSSDSAANGFDEFISDPARPVPFIGRPANTMVVDYKTADQRFASSRPDVLVYQTPVLSEDLTIAGQVGVELNVSTTGTDADWVVKIIDVYPGDFPDPDPNPTQVKMGGYQQLVRGDVMRGKFRNSFEKPEPFTPGAVTTVKFKLPDTLHTFRSGHKVMVHVQSSWFPLMDRNPQAFCDIYNAKEADFRRATHRVYHSSEHPSRVTLPVVPNP
jgi:putative CocE/NonD family hydrolase